MPDKLNVASENIDDVNYEVKKNESLVALIYKLVELLLAAVALLKAIRASRIKSEDKKKIDDLISRVDSFQTKLS